MMAGFRGALLTVSSPALTPGAPPLTVADETQDTEASLYKAGTASMDRGDWREAERAFGKVVALKGEHADAALYWRAYAFNKMTMREDALKSVAALKAAYPKSTWLKDARFLEQEIRQASGQAPQVASAG